MVRSEYFPQTKNFSQASSLVILLPEQQNVTYLPDEIRFRWILFNETLPFTNI